MSNKHPIIEGYIAGGAAMIVFILWVWSGAFKDFSYRPLILFSLFYLGFLILFYTILRQWIKEEKLVLWLTKHPVRFYAIAFVVFATIVVFFDCFKFSEKLDNILVEAHGLIFDLLVFGILFAIYDKFKIESEEIKKDTKDKQQRIKRYKEELEDYRGWTENEAAYRISGIIRRLKNEGEENILYTNLHLGRLHKTELVKIIKKKVTVASLKGAKLKGAKLQNADLRGVNLQEANLVGVKLQNSKLQKIELQKSNLTFANLQEANLEWADLFDARLMSADLSRTNLSKANLENTNLVRTNLDGANLCEAILKNAYMYDTSLKDVKVSTIDWFKKLQEWNVKHIERIESLYYIDPNIVEDKSGSYFIIREKNASLFFP